MTGQSVVVVIGTDGAVRIDAHGYAGSDCERATRALRESMGVVKSHKRTSDYNRVSVQTHGQTQKQGG
jgi:hypothetical protein